MHWSVAIRDITVFAVVGAVVGLLLGLALSATDTIDNPFVVVAFGIVAGAAASLSRFRRWER